MKTFIIYLFSFFTIISVNAQDISIIKASDIKIEELPKYVIITSQNTKTLGGIGLNIDTKKSRYKKQLKCLLHLLEHRKKLKIRNQTDLLNVMDVIGYEFVDVYNASQVQYAMDKDIGDDIVNEIFDGGTGAFKVNMIFKKK
ncbi:hypothetical protein [Tenacibaculum soleae]|uniref:hypothetical protein n=1 Tax=Tenacibaculum soleae TaxID=447689 RepID=UPI002301BB53|nr:hypothetical protein [Tenacibaculum soleae]